MRRRRGGNGDVHSVEVVFAKGAAAKGPNSAFGRGALIRSSLDQRLAAPRPTGEGQGAVPDRDTGRGEGWGRAFSASVMRVWDDVVCLGGLGLGRSGLGLGGLGLGALGLGGLGLGGLG